MRVLLDENIDRQLKGSFAAEFEVVTVAHTMTDEVHEYSPKRYSEVKLVRVLEGKSHAHCHFTDVNGKGATFEGFDFSYCIFIRAYFHNATFSNCKFVGAHFVDCNFRNAQIRGCDFSYSSFNNTRITTNEIIRNLPSQPNVRRELLQILRRNATSVGDYRAEKIFVIREIDSEKEHYRLAWRRDDQYYQNKYGSNLKWLWAGFILLALKMDNFVWGHGERLWKTPIALTVLLLVLSAIAVAIRLPSADDVTLSEALSVFWAAFSYHVNLLLGLSDGSAINGIPIIDWIIVLTRLVAIGVIVAALYRRLSHR